MGRFIPDYALLHPGYGNTDPNQTVECVTGQAGLTGYTPIHGRIATNPPLTSSHLKTPLHDPGP